ncbi:heme peroxidase [Dendrothele bispora CBS 962.96]|uniref:Peroxidase n=1 Tax=Dendrothele bispora (strain CBS 962.96) TaxID=1314807 RepID=A0A4S8MLN0_DENBC|nr:heme peroxidase [Dendrothele bispora CBS 962.96]
MITHDAEAGTGGLDGSLLFEMDRDENKGAISFNETYAFLGSMYSDALSISDITALGMYVTVANCGGPILKMRAGRVDATEAGPSGVPEPTNDTPTMVARFAKAGMNVTQMVASVACGHTLGGIHGNDFPEIAGPGRSNDTDFLLFDSSATRFDNKVVTEYFSGNTSNLLVVGPEATNSDKRVFLADQNITMQALSTPEVFSSMCASVFEKMMDTVPSSVKLSDPIEPYPVKPTQLDIALTPEGNITFEGALRIQSGDRENVDDLVVKMPYKDRTGNACDGCTIETRPATFQGGFGSGFGGSFKFFQFSTSLPASTSISNFNVTIQPPNSSDIEIQDNNGVGFPIDDRIIPLQDQSCINEGPFEGDENKWNMTIVAAIRDELADKPVKLEVAVKTPRQGVIIPAIIKQSVQMEPWSDVENFKTAGYTLFKASFGLLVDSLQSSYDVVSGEGDEEVRKVFVGTGSLISKECKPWA